MVHNSFGSGTVTSAAATLTVFVDAGTYNGLFSENEVKHSSSGFLTFNLASTRSFSGSIKIEGGSYLLSGLFDANTFSANSTVLRTGKTTLSVHMELIQTDDTVQVTGSVTDGTWTASLLGDRAYYRTGHIAPQAGNYTMTLFTDSNGDTMPSNGSYGIATVRTNGTVSLTGLMSDAVGIAQATSISKAGQWPLYVPLYAGKGSLLSWVTFTNAPIYKLTGNVSWIKTNASGLYYINGFTNSLTVYGGSRHP